MNLLDDPKEKPEITDIYIDANYNLGLLYFVTDQYLLAKNRIDLSIKAKRELKQEEITEQMANFYETLGEIELEYKNHQLSYFNLQKALEIRSKLPNSDDIKTKMKTNIMLDFLYQSLEKDIEKKNKTPNDNDKAFLRGDDRNLDDVLSYMRVINDDKGETKKKGETSKKVRQEFDIDEMEKFFLLMSKLTAQQINVLNETQLNFLTNPNIIKLPILFSAEFKNVISVNQRLEVCNLKLMSLKRNKILKDPFQKIEVENLNYDALYSKNFQNNLTNIKNYFVVNKILKNWENTTKVGANLNTQMNPSMSSNSNQIRHSRLSIKDNIASKSSFIASNNNLYSNSAVNVDSKQNNLNTNEINDKYNEDSKFFFIFLVEFKDFKKCVFNYAEINDNEEMLDNLKSDEDLLVQIFKELDKDDLTMIMENPEIIFQYIVLAKENEKTKIELNNFDEINTSPYSRKEDPKINLKEYLKEDNKIKEESFEESYNSEKSPKSKKMEHNSNIIDTSNVNDENNNDKAHRLFSQKNLEKNKISEKKDSFIVEENAKINENKDKEKPVVEEKKENIVKVNEKPVEEVKKEKIVDAPKTEIKPNTHIPNNIKNLLMKQSNEKTLKKDGSNPSLNELN